MKTFTKILLVLFFITLVPAIYFGRYIFANFSAVEGGFVFTYDTFSILGIIFSVLNMILGTILYFKFLYSLSLSKMIFFSVMPVTLLYAVALYMLVDIQNKTTQMSKNIRLLLNISTENSYNTILWAILLTIVYFIILLFSFSLSCKPMNRVEKVMARLSDGRMKEDKVDIGGGKQFQNIEKSINKINYAYQENDNVLKRTSLIKGKYVSKQFVNLFDKNEISALEIGQQIKKKAFVMRCQLKSDQEKDVDLKESFDFLKIYMKTISPLIKKYGGYIEKFLSDGILAIFSDAEKGLSCANHIVKSIKTKNTFSNKLPVRPSLCLYNDELVFELGDNERKVPYVVSDIMTKSEKFLQINDYLHTYIVFDKSTLNEISLKGKFLYRMVGNIKIDDEDVFIYENFDCYRREKREGLKRMKDVFEIGVRLYNESLYDKAKESFERVLKQVPNDRPAYIYFNKSEEKTNKAKIN